LGFSYTEKTNLPLTGGTSWVNNGASGVVRYSDLSIRGFALPREVAIGAAFKPDDKWLLSAKINWIQWSDAIKDVTTTWQDPDSPSATSELRTVNPQNWHDQLVYALGAAYRYDDKTTLYAGYNYGKNPVPKNNSSALLAATLEQHVTAGLARKLDAHWKITSGIEWLVPKKVTYDSNVFGNNAEVNNGGFFLHMMLSKEW
jgi:long-chain fatty acid transport protein